MRLLLSICRNDTQLVLMAVETRAFLAIEAFR